MESGTAWIIAEGDRDTLHTTALKPVVAHVFPPRYKHRSGAAKGGDCSKVAHVLSGQFFKDMIRALILPAEARTFQMLRKMDDCCDRQTGCVTRFQAGYTRGGPTIR